jgi:hypothetical protein
MFEKKNKFDEEINKLWANAFKLAEKIDELEKKLNKMEESFKAKEEREYVSTIKGFETGEDYQKFHDICTDIAIKDETFKFEGNREAKEITVYSSDKDLLHKKSMWLIKKTNISSLKYTIR